MASVETPRTADQSWTDSDRGTDIRSDVSLYLLPPVPGPFPKFSQLLPSEWDFEGSAQALSKC